MSAALRELLTDGSLVIEPVCSDTFASHRRVHVLKSAPEVRYILVVDDEHSAGLLHYRVGQEWKSALFEGTDIVIELPGVDVTFRVDEI